MSSKKTTPPVTTPPTERATAVKAHALELGFDVARVGTPISMAKYLEEWLTLGYHGDMAWMADKASVRADPKKLWPEVKSVIAVGLNYGPDHSPLDNLDFPNRGNISVYARGDDYHDVLKKRLKALGRWMASTYSCELKVFVDTAPVMEKPLAANAGLGWQGKHTNVVSREFGSWLFLGIVYTNLELTPDPPEKDHCGRCRKCLDICPTNAFPAPYQMDARRCISYLTIENKGSIPLEFRKAIGNRIYGCDDCLAVCPWNKFAQQSTTAQLHAREELAGKKLADYLKLDDASFRKLFRKSPIKRIGINRFLRNVLIACGNSNDPTLLPHIKPHIASTDPVVAEAASWACQELSHNQGSSRP